MMSHTLLGFFHEVNNVSLHDNFCKCVHFFPASIPRQGLIRCMPCHAMRMIQREGEVMDTKDRDRGREVQEMEMIRMMHRQIHKGCGRWRI